MVKEDRICLRNRVTGNQLKIKMAKGKSTKKAAATAAAKTTIPENRITKAVAQLTKYIENKRAEEGEAQEKSNDLLGGDIEDIDQNVQLIAVNAQSFTGSTKQFKLKLVDVKNSLYVPWKKESVTAIKDFKCLLILKDQDLSKISQDDLFDALSENENISIDEIIGLKSLKTTYKAYEARKAFVQQFSLILADDGAITTLPKLLGGKAFDKVETTPIGIKTRPSSSKEFSKQTLVNSIKKVFLNKLPIKLPRGTTLNAHLGQLNWFKQDELVQNIESVSKTLIEQYKIRSIFVKTNKSPVLPLYYNEDVLDELLESKKGAKSDEAKETVTIDGVEVELSNFEKSLFEIANPNELSSIFSKNIKDAKRAREGEENEEQKSKKSKK